MNDYNKAVQQLRENGYVEDNLVNRLSSEDLQRAVAEASQPA
jgi:hypothetical protein